MQSKNAGSYLKTDNNSLIIREKPVVQQGRFNDPDPLSYKSEIQVPAPVTEPVRKEFVRILSVAYTAIKDIFRT